MSELTVAQRDKLMADLKVVVTDAGRSAYSEVRNAPVTDALTRW